MIKWLADLIINKKRINNLPQVMSNQIHLWKKQELVIAEEQNASNFTVTVFQWASSAVLNVIVRAAVIVKMIKFKEMMQFYRFLISIQKLFPQKLNRKVKFFYIKKAAIVVDQIVWKNIVNAIQLEFNVAINVNVTIVKILVLKIKI